MPLRCKTQSKPSVAAAVTVQLLPHDTLFSPVTAEQAPLVHWALLVQ
jgi:hypothetical protein